MRMKIKTQSKWIAEANYYGETKINETNLNSQAYTHLKFYFGLCVEREKIEYAIVFFFSQILCTSSFVQ